MEIIEIKNLSFAYPDSYRLILNNINLKINKGDFVLLCGESGCGKTTLLRHLKKELTPYGSVKGDVVTKDISVGFVMQDPDSQIVTDKVWHELAFGFENMGMDTASIKLRCGEIASFFGINTWYHKNTFELSGGQKQILNLAGVLAMKPDVIVLDEPLSQLDPLASIEFINAVVRINRELGIAVVMSEHNLNTVMAYANKVVVMDKGEIIGEDAPEHIMSCLKDKSHTMQKAMPSGVRIHSALCGKGKSPLTVAEGKLWLEEFTDKRLSLNWQKRDLKDVVIKGKELFFAYNKNNDIVKNMDIEVTEGEVFAILGGNGAGKTSALKILSGAEKPYYGKLNIKGKVVMLPQSPIALFTERTVLLDLKQCGRDISEAVKAMEIESLLDMNPKDLSGGELQRCAIAKLMLTGADIFLLDEPTKGIDAFMKARLGKLIKSLNKTVVIVSHDVDFCAQFADRCALFFDGQLINCCDTHSFFADNFFYTTDGAKIGSNVVKGAISCDEIINALGGSENIKKTDTKPFMPINMVNKKEEIIKKTAGKRAVVSAVIILLLIPLAIWCGIRFLDDRKYYAVSMAILLFTMTPFFMIFESRKFRAREIVIVASMCVLCVGGRILFAPFPQIKPMAALVIVSGICLGSEAGFVTGALGAFCSNFYFGQGPWTPWQMFAFGIIGFLSGLLRKALVNSDNMPNKILMPAFSFVSVMFIYGGIMNTSSVLMYQPSPTLGMILAAMATGFVFDLTHALSTVVFILIFAKPLTEKVLRVKKKFGLL